MRKIDNETQSVKRLRFKEKKQHNQLHYLKIGHQKNELNLTNTVKMQIRHTYHPSKSDIVILSTHTFIQNHSLQEIPEFDIIYSIAQKFVSVLHYVLRLSIE